MTCKTTVRSLVMSTILATGMAMPGYALGVGGGAEGGVGGAAGGAAGGVAGGAAAEAGAGAGVGVGVDGDGVGADAGVEAGVDAGVGVGTNSDDGDTADNSDSASATIDGSVAAAADDQGVSLHTMEDTEASASASLGGSGAAMIETGTSVMSADGETIGTVAGTREDNKDGSLQAIVDLDSSVALPVSKLALEAQDLAVDTNGALTYDISMSELRSRVNAQVGAQASSMSD